MFGVYLNDILVGIVKIESSQLTFSYVEDVSLEKLVKEFPEIKTYYGSEVFSFILNRVNLVEARQAKSIEELITKAEKVSFSSLVIKRIAE